MLEVKVRLAIGREQVGKAPKTGNDYLGWLVQQTPTHNSRLLNEGTQSEKLRATRQMCVCT